MRYRFVVPKPATQRPKLPGVGRLGLVEPTARADLTGWAGTPTRTSNCCGRCRARPTPTRRCAPWSGWPRRSVADWDELNTALLKDKCLRGRLFARARFVAGTRRPPGGPPAVLASAATGRVELPSAAELQRGFTDCVAETPLPTVSPALRKLYRDRLLVLAALDVAPTVENEPVLPFATVGEHLSDLADAALGAALQVAINTVCKDGTPPPRLAVIAMGKCGARELNYVSDVDVIFVGENADAITTRVAGEMMRMASETFFEVDAALRPEGKRGQLVRTLDSHIAYYQRWAKTWEFQALLKARPAVGDAELGEQYMDALMPMVWTACERDDFVADVQAMRRRVENWCPPMCATARLKLGTGGLRDVEFAVQLLQLVHGRNDDSLHVTSTVEALAALAAGGYVGRDDAANMTASYEFLRLLEHRLQLQRLKRTHMLPAPDDDEALRWLARAAHVRPDGKHDALGVLREELKRQSVRVSRLHAKLFYQPLLESTGGSVELTPGMSAEAAERQLAALGYQSPQSALTHLAALANQSGRRGRVQAVLLPTLLDWLSDTPDPDAGLLAVSAAVRGAGRPALVPRHAARRERGGQAADARAGHLGIRAGAVDAGTRGHPVLRRRPDRPQAARHRARSGGPGAGRRGGPAVRPGEGDRGRAHPAPPRTGPDRFGGSARHARGARGVQSADLDLGCGAAGRAGSGHPRQHAEDGQAPATIAVIGMGRLGGGELGYGSDADVMFVCEPAEGVDEAVAVKWSVTVAEQMRALLGTPSADPPLEVDANLRPEGRNGPLVRTLASYAAYYKQWAQPWEIQALLRAHRVAGDLELGDRFLLMIDATRYPPGGVSAEDGAGDPPGQGPGRRRAAAPRCGSQHPHQARSRRTGRCRVDGAAAAVALRRQNPGAAQHLDAGVAGRHRRRRVDRRR